jgi:hypothetical protein
MNDEQHALSILDKISGVSKRGLKEEYLREGLKNEFFVKLIQMNLDEKRLFHVKKLAKKFKMSAGHVDCSNIFEVGELLEKRLITGDKANNTVMRFFEDLEEKQRFWYSKVLFKKAIGIGIPTVNSVAGFDLIKKFVILKAPREMLDDFNKLVYPCLGLYKMDGFRTLKMPTNGLISASGESVKNKALQERYKACKYPHVLDGELWSPELDFEEVESIATKESEPCPPHLRLFPFDVLSYQEWENRQCHDVYEDRLWFIERDLLGNDLYGNVSSVILSNAAEAEAFYDDCIAKGFEGAIYRSLSGLYEWKRTTLRSQTIIKKKPIDYTDAKVIDVKQQDKTLTKALKDNLLKKHPLYSEQIIDWEIGKLTPMVGKLVCQLDPSGHVLPIGGLKDEDKIKWWINPNEIIGGWIEIKSDGVTKKGSLRFPRFHRTRDAK